MMTSFGRYALIGQPSHRATPPTACKRLRLAVFVPRIAACLDYSVRVYFVEDTISALEVSRRISVFSTSRRRQCFCVTEWAKK